ncbi:MAG: hypothetical protein ACEPOW_01550 [Bacteroidales bacterium]
MIKNKILNFGILFSFILIIFFSCRKEDDFNNSSSFQLKFSTDTLVFDTIFAKVGSATRKITVLNTSNKAIKINNIKVIGGNNSPYQINVDGRAGNTQNNIEIDANDSIYIFANVTIDPTEKNNPFVVEDNISFSVNGNQQKVVLQAWGLNANYIVADDFDRYPTFKLHYKIVAKKGETVIWTNERPYFIYGGFARINGKLIIEKGTKVYCYAGTGIWSAPDAAIDINGTKEEPVIIQGSRTTGFDKDYAGQWNRIMINESNQDSHINYAIIKNGVIGIQPETKRIIKSNKLYISNSIIENHSIANIYAVASRIQGENLVLGNAGQGGVFLRNGGDYSFKQITVGNYSKTSRENPAFYVENWIKKNNQQIPFDLNLFIGNSIISGKNTGEEYFDTIIPSQTTTTNIKIQNCLLSTSRKIENFPDRYINTIINKDPKFYGVENEIKNNNKEKETPMYFELTAGSPAIGIGDPKIASEVPKDIKGNNRALPKPDLGAYQSDFSPKLSPIR